jgi:hypothetical protein
MTTVTIRNISPKGPGSPKKKKGKTKKNPEEDCSLESESIATPTNIRIMPKTTMNP